MMYFALDLTVIMWLLASKYWVTMQFKADRLQNLMIVVAKKYICVAIVIINDQKQDTGIREIQQPVARRSWILSHNTCYG